MRIKVAISMQRFLADTARPWVASYSGSKSTDLINCIARFAMQRRLNRDQDLPLITTAETVPKTTRPPEGGLLLKYHKLTGRT
jgi:hypothetical protein